MHDFIDNLCEVNDSKIVLIVMDGLGGIQGDDGKTELQAANTPNLDKLAKESVCGTMDPIIKGVTPGSGPSHLALFGYDPIKFNIGRGALSATGINFPLKHGDLCARVNFATIDSNGNVIDRRAGRISTEENQRICKKIKENIDLSEFNVEFYIETESEHRAALILRGEGLSDNITDNDPQKTGVPPLEFKGGEGAELTLKIVNKIVSEAKRILSDEPKANMLLLRGFAKYHKLPSFEERFKLKAASIAAYPMYKGLSRLVGMHVFEGCKTLEDEISLLEKEYKNFDFFYVHVKKTDSYGEDGNFNNKVKVIEEMDSLLPRIIDLNPDVIVVTADHSTPSALKGHSWHAVPVCLWSKYARKDRCEVFNEIEFAEKGGLGRFPSVELMGLMLAHALRLKKYGA